MDFLKRYAGTTFNALVDAEGQDDNTASGLEQKIFEKIRQPSDSSEPASNPKEPRADEESDTEEDKGEDEAKMEQPKPPHFLHGRLLLHGGLLLQHMMDLRILPSAFLIWRQRWRD